MSTPAACIAVHSALQSQTGTRTVRIPRQPPGALVFGGDVVRRRIAERALRVRDVQVRREEYDLRAGWVDFGKDLVQRGAVSIQPGGGAPGVVQPVADDDQIGVQPQHAAIQPPPSAVPPEIPTFTITGTTVGNSVAKICRTRAA